MNTSAENAARRLSIWQGVFPSQRLNARNAGHPNRKSRCQRSAPAGAVETIHPHARPAHVRRERARWGNMIHTGHEYGQYL